MKKIEHKHKTTNEVIPFFIRESTSDENVYKEVIGGVYENRNADFKIESGEIWLDLGANIGAFSLFCEERGAKTICFEPDPTNFSMLEKNLNILNSRKNKNHKHDFYEACVSSSREESLSLFTSKDKSKKSRTTLKQKNGYSSECLANNLFIGELSEIVNFDCIKMDIEGSELDMIDSRLIPDCEKLVLEYHFSNDKSMSNFNKRMNILREKFKTVYYFKSLDNMIENRVEKYPGFFDRMIYCKK